MGPRQAGGCTNLDKDSRLEFLVDALARNEGAELGAEWGVAHLDHGQRVERVVGDLDVPAQSGGEGPPCRIGGQVLAHREHMIRGRYHGGRRPSSDDSFHSPAVILPSALDKPSIMKRYHRRRTCSHTSPRRSPTMITLHDTRFVECRWWNDGWTVVTWRSSASMIPAPDSIRIVPHRTGCHS